MAEYNFLDRLLHRLALQVPAFAEMSFDIDQKLVRTNAERIISERHVFVSGLARSGTTALMRRFYATGYYSSLTYRDMPFVLAPNLWSKIVATSKTQVPAAERAHGDGILIGAESPESLEEPFWRVFCGSEYIHKDCITPHSPDAEILRSYVRYVNAILSSANNDVRRYLAKNNNNILRLASIRRAFPNAVILVPFREPLAHAHSLLRQHRHFCELQAKEKFILSYMNWLGHQEFGLGHKPFCFDGKSKKSANEIERNSIEYWLREWCEVYEWLEKSAPKDAIFVCYEDLCSSADIWHALCKHADIPISDVTEDFSRKGEKQIPVSEDDALTHRALGIYERLRTRFLSTIG